MEYMKAFLIGGLICMVGQILIDKTKLTPARILVGYVIAGVLLGAIGIYKPVAEFAGAGASVPLTGFGFSHLKRYYFLVPVSGVWQRGSDWPSWLRCSALVQSDAAMVGSRDILFKVTTGALGCGSRMDSEWLLCEQGRLQMDYLRGRAEQTARSASICGALIEGLP